MEFPLFDPAWSWAGASLLLTSPTHLIFIKRSQSMPTHAGQMAFFGGHKKESEQHPFEVARREFVEESGLAEKNIECVGVLAPVMTARAQPIVPVVATLRMSPEDFLTAARSNGEWEDLVAVPWSELRNEAIWDWGYFNGPRVYKVLTLPLHAGRYLHFRGDNSRSYVLWGATARMVWNYLSIYHAALKKDL